MKLNNFKVKLNDNTIIEAESAELNSNELLDLVNNNLSINGSLVSEKIKSIDYDELEIGDLIEFKVKDTIGKGYVINKYVSASTSLDYIRYILVFDMDNKNTNCISEDNITSIISKVEYDIYVVNIDDYILFEFESNAIVGKVIELDFPDQSFVVKSDYTVCNTKLKKHNVIRNMTKHYSDYDR